MTKIDSSVQAELEGQRSAALALRDWHSPVLSDAERLSFAHIDRQPDGPVTAEFQRLHSLGGEAVNKGTHTFYPDGAYQQNDWPHEFFYDPDDVYHTAKAQKLYYEALHDKKKGEFAELKHRLETAAANSIGQTKGNINSPELSATEAKAKLIELRDAARDAATKSAEAAKRMEAAKPVKPYELRDKELRERKQNEHREVVAAIEGIEL